jgi:hypothetical protein
MFSSGAEFMTSKKAKLALMEAVEPQYASVDQCEILTDVSRWTWRRMAYDGRIESVKVGARLLIPLSEVRRVVEEGTRPRSDGKAAGEPSQKAQRYPATTETDTAVTARA